MIGQSTIPIPDLRQVRRESVKKAYDLIDDKLVFTYSMKVYSACNLLWDYIDTIIDLSITEGRDNKKLCRALRQYKAAYDRFRWHIVGEKGYEEETENGLRLEDILDGKMRTILNSIEFELGKLHLSPEEKMFRIAVFQALTLGEGVKKYSTGMDEYLRRIGILKPTITYSMIQDELLKALALLPSFISDPNNRTYNGLKFNASVICTRLKEIEVIRDNGESLGY